jgi:hypothetical protein
MEFTLFYQGALKAKRDIANKQEIRRVIHNQLSELWKYEELMNMKERFIKSEFKDNWIVRNFRFLPLITNKNKQVAQLDIVILWPDAPGSIVANRGDIDARLKTLLDSLTVPQKDAIGKEDSPRKGEDLFYCLLEDDKLISRISIETFHLLEPGIKENEVKLFIKVKIKDTMMCFDGVSFLTDY